MNKVIERALDEVMRVAPYTREDPALGAIVGPMEIVPMPVVPRPRAFLRAGFPRIVPAGSISGPPIWQPLGPGYLWKMNDPEEHIEMLEPTAFRRPEFYLHALLHEHAHASGHWSRLKRPSLMATGMMFVDRYTRAREEITVDLAAAVAMEALGFATDEARKVHLRYLAVWLKNANADVDLVRDRAEDALAAARYMVRPEAIAYSEFIS